MTERTEEDFRRETDASLAILAKAQSSWHLGKEIPIVLICALLVQTAGIVWQAATLSARFDNLERQVASMSNAQYTSKEAMTMGEVNRQRNLEQDRRMGELEGRVREIEMGRRNK